MYELITALAAILLPGYVFKRFYSKFLVLNADKHHEDTLIGYILAGIVVTFITLPFVAAFGFAPTGALIVANDFNAIGKELSSNAFRWIIQLIAAPVFLAMVAAYIERKAWGADLLTRIGLPPQPRYPNALNQACYVHRQADPIVAVERKNGEVIYGRMGPRAVVTAEDGYPDLFLDAIYFLDLANGDLVEDEDCSGQVILGSEIATITFYVNPLMRGDFDEDDGDDDTATSTET